MYKEIMGSNFPPNFPPHNLLQFANLYELDYQPTEYSYLCESLGVFYHIKCEEIINDYSIIGLVQQYDNVYHFDYTQPGTERVYRFTCRRLSSTFMFQFLNKCIYGREFTKFEKQEAFPVEHQEVLKDHLIKDLTCYLEQKQISTQNEMLEMMFIEQYQYYAAGSNTGMLYHFFSYPYN
jgi:hypothetical protein